MLEGGRRSRRADGRANLRPETQFCIDRRRRRLEPPDHRQAFGPHPRPDDGAIRPFGRCPLARGGGEDRRRHRRRGQGRGQRCPDVEASRRMSVASQWGVPDWLRPQDYPAPRGAAKATWAWEFLRRNKEYRAVWLYMESFNGRIGCDQTGKFWRYYREMREKFGIVDPCNPRQNNWIPAFSDLGTTYVEAPALRWERLPCDDPAGSSGFVRPSRANLSKETILENSRFTLSWFEIGFAIDLRLPLDGQFKAIRKLAEEDQLALKKAGRINPKTARTSDQYVRYLRILDAEDAGVKRSVVMDALFADIENGYSAGRLRSKAFDNARTEAQRLRDSGYRALARVTPSTLN